MILIPKTVFEKRLNESNNRYQPVPILVADPAGSWPFATKLVSGRYYTPFLKTKWTLALAERFMEIDG